MANLDVPPPPPVAPPPPPPVVDEDDFTFERRHGLKQYLQHLDFIATVMLGLALTALGLAAMLFVGGQQPGELLALAAIAALSTGLGALWTWAITGLIRVVIAIEEHLLNL